MAETLINGIMGIANSANDMATNLNGPDGAAGASNGPVELDSQANPNQMAATILTGVNAIAHSAISMASQLAKLDQDKNPYEDGDIEEAEAK